MAFKSSMIKSSIRTPTSSMSPTIFIPGYRNNIDQITPPNAKIDLEQAVNGKHPSLNPTATFINLQSPNDWDVSHVTDMKLMFQNSSFNKPINNWDVSNATSMRGMFRDSIYNHSLDEWNDKLGNVNDMSFMFYNSKFNHSINNWDVSNVRDMAYMFKQSIYDLPLDGWSNKLGFVLKMNNMFEESIFNQTINDWDVSNVRDMSYMFQNSIYNKPLDGWSNKVRNVRDMTSMFEASEFNHPINNWILSQHGRSISNMFKNSQYSHSLPGDYQVHIRTVVEQLSAKTYDPEMIVTDFIALEDGTIGHFLGNEKMFIILSVNGKSGMAFNIDYFKKMYRKDYVECSLEEPVELQDGREFTRMLGPGGSEIFIYKPVWFHGLPPANRVFQMVKDEVPLTRIMTKLPPSQTDPSDEKCLKDTPKDLFTLVTLITEDRGAEDRGAEDRGARGGRVKSRRKRTNKKSKKKLNQKSRKIKR